MRMLGDSVNCPSRSSRRPYRDAPTIYLLAFAARERRAAWLNINHAIILFNFKDSRLQLPVHRFKATDPLSARTGTFGSSSTGWSVQCYASVCALAYEAWGELLIDDELRVSLPQSCHVSGGQICSQCPGDISKLSLLLETLFQLL